LIRERNLIASIPPSLVDLLPNRLKLHHVNTAHHQTVQLDTDDPLSVHYNGPFVPFAYSDPSKAEWSEWYDLLDDYVDGRKGVMDVKKDKEGKFRGGGFDLKLFWEMEVRSAVESLGVEPL
jgi:CDK-activating kinase assembly factor MAT1